MNLKIRILPAAIAGALAATMFNTAQAQTAPAVTPKAEEKIDTVTVTGTRIKSPGFVSSSPITSVGTAEIQSSQPVAVEEFIKLLPASVPAIGPGTNNGSGGGATIDLRGLGPNRSLVLIDGRRVVPFDLGGAVDTNSIPLALLQRVDLVTGGASAVYGADAIAGVLNFVLRKDFKGVELNTSYGFSDKNDALRKRTDLTVGSGSDDGRSNVVLTMGFTETQALRQDARELGLTARSSTTGLPQGSNTDVPAQFLSLTGFPGITQLNTTTGAIGPLFSTFNFNPVNLFQTPLKRKQMTALGNYVINNYAELYTNVMYSSSDVRAQLASSGSFLNTYQVPIGNPFIPAAMRAQLCAANNIAAANCLVGNPTEIPMAIGRRFVELGPRLQSWENKLLQATGGLKGDIAGSWTYDAYWSYGRSDQVQSRVNWGSLSKLQQALRALNTTSCTVASNGCVPINVFGAAGTITPAMVNFINLSSLLTQRVEQQVASASASGDFGNRFKSPFSKSLVSAAFGAEYRKVSAGNKSDGSSQIQGEVLGTGAPLPDRSGEFDLKETFAELVIPLISDKPFARSLSLEVGLRQTKFTTTASESYDTYKYGGEWEPVQGFRFRAMAQKATRAPNVNELFAPQVTGLSNLAIDPCQGTRINAAQANTAGTLSNLCRLTGVAVSQIGQLPAPSAGQINVLTGGNPALKAEEAETTTIGFVFQPTFIKNFALSLDYYDIKLTKQVSSPSTTDVLNGCYSTAINPTFAFNALCASIFRSPSTSTFNGVDSRGVVTPSSNLGRSRTNGYDLTINYSFSMKDLGFDPKLGRIDLALNANRLQTFENQPLPTSVNRDCVAFYSNACLTNLNLSPKTKFSQRATWTVSDFTFGYNWRYLGEVQVEPGSGTWFPAYSKIEAYNYVDFSAVWSATKNIRLNLSVSNAFDKKPPVVGNTIATTGTNSGNTFPQYYDTIGRYFTVGATVRF